MTDKEIIKALECCLSTPVDCDNCAYTKYPVKDSNTNLIKDISDLINCQQTEIDRLREKDLTDTKSFMLLSENYIRAETIKEFVEKLKEKVSLFSAIGTQEFADGAAEALEWYDKKVEETLKEMAGIFDKGTGGQAGDETAQNRSINGF